MKRPSEAQHSQRPNKKIRPNPAEDHIQPWQYTAYEPALWGNILGFLKKDGINLLSTASFFTQNIPPSYKHPIFLHNIQEVFDYYDESELENFTELTKHYGQKLIDKQSFSTLVNHFVTRLQSVLPVIDDLQSKQQIASCLLTNAQDDNPDIVDLPFMKENFLEDEDHEFLAILRTAVITGNLLIFKKLEKLLPSFMERCINNIDDSMMTPFAYAAAFNRKRICCKLLEKCENPFSEDISYDLGAAFVFSMRSIHVLALHANNDFLIHIYQYHDYTLSGVFVDEYADAIWDILINDHEALAEKLKQDASLLTATDDGKWTLAQWAACFPNSIQCLNLLLDEGAERNHEESPPITYIAIAAGNLPALELLIDKDETIELFINGNSGLHLSVYNGHYEVTNFLIGVCKQDVNAVNERGETPVMVGKYDDNFTVKLSPERIAKRIRCVALLKDNDAVDNDILLNANQGENEVIFSV